MSKRDKWIDEALNEIHPVKEMAESVIRGLERGEDLTGQHYICLVIADHARAAGRALSYARKCKEEPQ